MLNYLEIKLSKENDFFFSANRETNTMSVKKDGQTEPASDDHDHCCFQIEDRYVQYIQFFKMCDYTVVVIRLAHIIIQEIAMNY